MSGPASARIQGSPSQFGVSPFHPDHGTHAWSGLPGPKPVPTAPTGLGAPPVPAGAR